MRHIRKLELVGFKSFCDRTLVTFNEGVTAIVGPNGCGKSNIADAISWVVGEQSAKSLRADRMEAVIFSGTQARKPTNLAEVVLTLSLEPGYPVPEPLSINPEEFTVSRRLYRSGESEYYVDGRRCRLKDIQALFEGTGLGPNSYALIEQGRIGQILSSRPADRRSLIEEAAHITLFKSRRYAAEMKLELAQQNLLRVNDIVREVARQLNLLRRQAAKARRYNRLREELRRVHQLKFCLELKQLEGRLEECMSRFQAAQERERSVLSGLAGEEEARAACQDACRREEAQVNELREGLSGLRVDAGAAQSARQRRESRKQDLEARRGELGREAAAIEERLQVAERERHRLEAAGRALTAELADEQSVLERERTRSESIREAIADTEKKMEELRAFLLNRAGQLSELRSMVARCQENLQRIAAHSARLEGERKAQARERAALAAQLGERRAQAESTAARQGELARRREETERRAAELEEQAEQLSAEAAALQEEYSIMQHRHSSLEEVERRRSNYSEGVQKYLSARLPGEDEVSAHTLADHLETDPMFEAAVEDYLNDPLQYILVERLDDAVRSVERLKRIGAGRCTFLTLGNGHVRETPSSRTPVSGEGVVGYLDQIVRMREDIKEAFERALPEYASTIVVSDLNTAFRMSESAPGGHFLTLAGEAYSPRGTLSAAGERKSMAGFLSLKREKRDLEDRLAILRVKIHTVKEGLARIRQDQATVAEALRTILTEARSVEIESVLLGHQIEQLTSDVRKLDQTENVAGMELSQLDVERREYEVRLQDAEKGISEIEERGRASSEEMNQYGARLESLKSENALLARILSELASAHAVKQERLSAAENDLRRLAGDMEEVRGRREANQSERVAVQAAISELEQGMREAELQIADLARRIADAETELGRRTAALQLRRDELALSENRLRDLHAAREQAMDERSRVEIEKTRLDNDLEHLQRSCLDEFHAPLGDLATRISEEDWKRGLEDVAQAHAQLRQKVENFGAINMRALEEYQELDERHTFLTYQRADIERSISDTHKAIAEINRRSIEQFDDAFANIRRNFQEVFRLLFKGGQCDLRLLDEGDLLDSGVDIVAQPPGKRLQNVLLLSGGEKALTALALLIAIFRYRPSPFCVMDEVDAPLDDANILRFTSLVNELSAQTQFILITHNKKTMETADMLYGVTMVEPGISQIVSVDLRPQLRALAG